jgi:hypothetical protein
MVFIIFSRRNGGAHGVAPDAHLIVAYAPGGAVGPRDEGGGCGIAVRSRFFHAVYCRAALAISEPTVRLTASAMPANESAVQLSEADV